MDIENSTDNTQSIYKIDTAMISFENTDICEICTRYVCVCNDNEDVSDIKSYSPNEDPEKEDTVNDTENNDNNEDNEDNEDNNFEDEDEDEDDEDDEDDDQDAIYNDDDLENYEYSYDDSFYRAKKKLRELHEQEEELRIYNYHLFKDSGDWRYAKMLVQQSYIDNSRTVFLLDYLDKLLFQNNDEFKNIKTVYYKHDEDFAEVIQFDETEGKYLVENLKINEYKPNGILFNSDNKWNFKITVITTKNIYSANRYISDDLIGMY
jgi:hypothetical protein